MSNSTTKACTLCGEDKPLTDYYADNRTRDGKCQRCKPCHDIYAKGWKSRNREKTLEYNRTHYHRSGVHYRRYGLTKEQFDALLQSQQGVCAICQQPETVIVRGRLRPLHIDHDHTTGRVRGLLCSACNTAIGKMKDDPSILRAAATYLERPAD